MGRDPMIRIQNWIFLPRNPCSSESGEWTNSIDPGHSTTITMALACIIR
jgi:hypothetical protein